MEIEFDPPKALWTLRTRGLDMARALDVLDGPHLTEEDERAAYGEVRHQTVGRLDNRMVVLVWTWRADRLRVISLRKANAREQASYDARLVASGRPRPPIR